MNPGSLALPIDERRRVALRNDIDELRAPIATGQKLTFGDGVRIAELDCEQEAVELRFGQRIRADLLDRILRRDDEKRIGQHARLAILRHLSLFHRLEQRALRLGRGAVDFVGEHDRVENRSRVKTKGLRALVEYRYAEHVGGQEITRELDPRVFEPEGRCERLRERRFADTGNVLDQKVSARDQAGQREFQRLVLADDNLRQLLQHDGEPVRGRDVLSDGADGHWTLLQNRQGGRSHCSVAPGYSSRASVGARLPGLGSSLDKGVVTRCDTGNDPPHLPISGFTTRPVDNLATLAYLTHSACSLHEMGPDHPECPQRLSAISDHVIALGLDGLIARSDATPATAEQLARVHTRAYVDAVSD